MAKQDSLLSPDWYRIAHLTPRLRPGISVSQQMMRGQRWFIFSDSVSGRHFRFNEPAYQFIASLDGKATIDEVWASQVESYPDTVPSQGAVIRILAHAFSENLLVGNLEPDTETIVGEQHKRAKKRRNATLNPLAFRIPLWDPDAMLSRYVQRVAWLFSPAVRWMMLAAIAIASVLLALNALAFANYSADHLGTSSMLLMLWLVFPLIKTVHELAHAFSIKLHGGEVHEVGLTVMMITPIPYVDATASNAFARKWHRMQVAAAGIFVEAFIASLALFFWLLLEPGLMRELAFSFVFVGAFSTLLVNGNPLLRFDGYYVFSDFIEVPNLGTRSGLFWQAFLKRRVAGIRQAQLDGRLPGETKWLWLYAPLSWLYRVALVTTICLLLSQWSALLGGFMLLLGAWMLVGKPLWKTLNWLLNSGELAGRRIRAQALAVCLSALLFALATIVPIPNRTYASAVVWLPDHAVLRAEADGVVEEFLASDEQVVVAGSPIAVLSNSRLNTELKRLDAELNAQRVEQARQFRDDADGSITGREAYETLKAQRAVLAERIDRLTIRADSNGVLSLSPGQFSVGQYVRKGTVIAHVIPDTHVTVRAMVRNEDVALVREQLKSIAVDLPIAGLPAVPASLAQVTPQATKTLISPAMSMEAGGSIEVRPAGETDQVQAAEPRFAVDLKLDAQSPSPVGARALAVFDHGSTTVVGWFSRVVRQSFLRHFSV
jgi:putative peptide zinc metalloprotease protein